MTTINTNNNAGIILSTPLYSNPVIIASGVSLTNNNGIAIEANNIAWTVQNSGAISGNSTSGFGVVTDGGGYIMNLTQGLINGNFGIDGDVDPLAVVNEGRITGGRAGIFLQDGGNVDNRNGGIIDGNSGVYGANAAFGVVNAGSIVGAASGTQSDGVRVGGGAGSSGNVDNLATGLISAADAVYGLSAPVSVVNAGAIAGNASSGTGVDLLAGGRVTNLNTGIISGSTGIFGGFSGSLAPADVVTVFNYGRIGGGIDLMTGGLVVNGSSGSFSGLAGIGGASRVLTVVNDGIIAVTRLGVSLQDGGTLTNQAGGTISGYIGVNGGYFGTSHGTVPTTIFNAGSITGVVPGLQQGAGVELQSGGLLSNAATGVISGVHVPGVYTNGGPVTVINAGAIISNTGTAIYLGGTAANRLVLEPGFAISGQVVAGQSARTTLELASAASTGIVTGLGTQFTNFATLVFDSGAVWSVTGNTTGLSGAIDGFAPGDTIDLTGVTATGSSYANGILTLNEVSGTAVLDLPGTFSTTSFRVAAVGSGTAVTVACFPAGTRILTSRGKIPVERLHLKDLVITETGDARPIIWLGHRRLDCRRHINPSHVWPIRIRRGAFSPGQPRRDLRLSPDHSVFVDGVLIPIRYLINGITIFQEERTRVTYWHVELEEHDVLLAEGLPVESYLDTGNRGSFAETSGLIYRHADSAGATPVRGKFGYAPLIEEGPIVSAVTARLVARAAELDRVLPHLDLILSQAGDYEVHIAPGIGRVRLMCPSGYVQNDRRRLGALIAGLKINGENLSASAYGRGFHMAETLDGSLVRWTDGEAFVEVGISDTVRYLMIDVRRLISAREECHVVRSAPQGQSRQRNTLEIIPVSQQRLFAGVPRLTASPSRSRPRTSSSTCP